MSDRVCTQLWHFCTIAEDGLPRLGYGDGREIVVGKTLQFDGTPVLCQAGLHASSKLADALSYAGGKKLSLTRVTLGGNIIHDNDKSVATERTCVAMLDADATEKLLRDWARWCALQVIHLWDAPDIVKQYLETGDESIRAAAGDAAWAAARAAAGDAAWAAARAAAGAAAGDAAWAAARAAAWAAARDAAWAELERRALDAMEVQSTNGAAK